MNASGKKTTSTKLEWRRKLWIIAGMPLNHFRSGRSQYWASSNRFSPTNYLHKYFHKRCKSINLKNTPKNFVQSTDDDPEVDFNRFHRSNHSLTFSRSLLLSCWSLEWSAWQGGWKVSEHPYSLNKLSNMSVKESLFPMWAPSHSGILRISFILGYHNCTYYNYQETMHLGTTNSSKSHNANRVYP